jgi:hypothetical protein
MTGGSPPYFFACKASRGIHSKKRNPPAIGIEANITGGSPPYFFAYKASRSIHSKKEIRPQLALKPI